MARALGHNAFGLFLFFLMAGSISLVALVISASELRTGILLCIATVVTVVVLFKSRLAIYLLIFSMLLSPELAVGGLATTGSSLGRGVTFRLDDFLLVVIGVSWLIRNALYQELGIFRRTPLNGAILFYIAACVLSTSLGLAAGRVQLLTGSLFVIKYIQYFILFFLVINNVDDEREIRRYWYAMLATAIIVGLIGMGQIPFGGRVTAPFEGADPEPNTFGGYLAFIILICLSLALTLRNYRQRVAYGLITLLLFIPFLFTLSRASYLAIVPGAVLVLFLGRNHLLSYLLASLALVLFLFPQVFPEAIRERVSFTWSQEFNPGQIVVLGQRLDTSTSARIGAFENAVRDFPRAPLLGYGVTGWRFIDAQYFRTLLESGLVGLSALLLLIYRLFRMGVDRFHSFRGNPFYQGLAMGFLGGLVALLFHGFGSNTFIIVRIMQPFWLVAGMIFMMESVVPRPSSGSRIARLPV